MVLALPDGAGVVQGSSFASLQHSFSAAMFMIAAICMSDWMAAAEQRNRPHGCVTCRRRVSHAGGVCLSGCSATRGIGERCRSAETIMHRNPVKAAVRRPSRLDKRTW